MSKFYNLICFAFILVSPLIISSQFTSSDLGPCTCDLTVNQCDLNCCCDTNCGNLTDTFTVSCTDQTVQPPSQFCIPTIFLFRNNTAFKSKVDGANTCFYNDSYALRNYYSTPEKMTAIDNETAADFLDSTFPLPQLVFTEYLTDATAYVAGKSIYVVYKLTDSFSEISMGYFGFPRPTLFSGQCRSDSTAAFLESETSKCTRTVTNLATECANLSALSPKFYEATNARILAQRNNALFSIEVLNNTNQFLPITVASCSPSSCDVAALADPIISGTECQNVVSKVVYEFISSDSVISSVNLHLTLANITTSQTSIQQDFEIYFLSAGQSRPNLNNPRSGNPGYLKGKPLITGTLNSGVIQLSASPVISIPTPGAVCSQNLNRESALFGINTRSSCYVQIEPTVSTTCTTLNTNIQAAILTSAGLSLDQTSYVAISADSSNSRVSEDWVPIILETSVSNPTPSNQTSLDRGCKDIYKGITFTIVTARVGAKSNAQNVIVGVKASIQVGEIRYLCKDFSCSDVGSQKVEIPTVIEYLDATSPLPGNTTTIPKFLSKANMDFFYPFNFDQPSSTVA